MNFADLRYTHLAHMTSMQQKRAVYARPYKSPKLLTNPLSTTFYRECWSLHLSPPLVKFDKKYNKGRSWNRFRRAISACIMRRSIKAIQYRQRRNKHNLIRKRHLIQVGQQCFLSSGSLFYQHSHQGINQSYHWSSLSSSHDFAKYNTSFLSSEQPWSTTSAFNAFCYLFPFTLGRPVPSQDVLQNLATISKHILIKESTPGTQKHRLYLSRCFEINWRVNKNWQEPWLFNSSINVLHLPHNASPTAIS